jgi:hypothetical protein
MGSHEGSAQRLPRHVRAMFVFGPCELIWELAMSQNSRREIKIDVQVQELRRLGMQYDA